MPTKKLASAVRILHRVSHTEKLAFPSNPGPVIRRALRESGWRWNGILWFRNVNSTAMVKPLKLPAIIAANDNIPQPEAATA